VQDIIGSDIVLALGRKSKKLEICGSKSTTDIIDKIRNS